MKKNKEVEIVTNHALQATMTPIGLEFKRNALMIGENYCRIYGIVKYPSETDYGWYSRLTNIPGTIVSITSTPLNNADLTTTISRNINQYRGIEMSTKDPLERQRKKKAADDMEKIMKQIDQNNEHVNQFTTEIMVLSRDEDDFLERCTRVESIANNIGCKLRILSSLQKEAYQHLAPTYSPNNKITEIIRRPFPVSTFVGGFPFAASGFNDGNGYYLGRDSDGGMIIYDHWKRGKSRTNSNITVIGDSGQGKSTAVKHIIISEYAHGTKIIIIDPESEYKDMCKNPKINGSWIDVAGGRGGMINPLQIRPAPRDTDDDESEEEDSEPLYTKGMGDLAIHLKTLEIFFKLYLPSLTDKHRAILGKTLIELYNGFKIEWETDISKFRNEDFPIMGDLYSLLEKKSEEETSYRDIYDELKLLLYAPAHGSDKHLWNGYTTINPNSSFICLDTKAITQMDSTVLSAQYFNVLNWCWEQMSRNQKEPVMLVADECWMMIDPKVPQALQFLRNVEKRARKYEGSIVVSTQNIVDFLDPSVKMYGQAVLDLPSIKFLFGSDGKSLMEVKEIFSLNEAQYDLVASKQRGVALMKIGSQAVKIKFTFSDSRLELFGKGGGR